MKIANTSTELNAPAKDIIKLLQDKTVRYINAGPSTVRRDKERTFKIKNVEHVWKAKKNRLRCITAEVTDIDDQADAKYRTLHLSGIEIVA